MEVPMLKSRLQYSYEYSVIYKVERCTKEKKARGENTKIITRNWIRSFGEVGRSGGR